MSIPVIVFLVLLAVLAAAAIAATFVSIAVDGYGQTRRPRSSDDLRR